MPLLNSTGALKQQRGTSVYPIPNNQWIAQINNSAYNTGALPQVFPDKYGNLYAAGNGSSNVSGSEGLTKLNGYGGLVYAFSTTSGSNLSILIDNNNNIYVGGNVGTSPNIIKYNSSGTIIWQTNISMGVTGASNFITAMGITPNNELLVIAGSRSGGAPSGGPKYTVVKMNLGTGAVINQRRVLNQLTSGPSDLYIDSYSGTVLIAGTDYQTQSQILIGFYDYNNTNVVSSMIYQSSPTDSYETYFGGQGNQSIVADNSYIYQTAYRIISGVTRSIYQKIDKSTGAVSYSNTITIGGNSLTLYGITKDNSGNLYVTGTSGSQAGYAYLIQIQASTGSIGWIKRLGNSSTTDVIGSPNWSNGFIYFSAAVTVFAPLATYYSIMKFKDDGSATDGTYGSHWIISTVTGTATTTSYLPANTGITTDSVIASTYASVSGSLGKVGNSITITTYNV